MRLAQGTYKFPVILIFAIQSIGSAYASNVNRDADAEILFILNPAPAPVTVSTNKPEDVGVQVMRLPDQARHKDSEPALNTSSRSYKSRTQLQVKASNAENEDPGNSSNSESLLKFKPANIIGTIKLPRVKFGSFSPSVQLREEMPSLDFISKSLRDVEP